MADTLWNWRAWNMGEQLIVIATLLAVASLFLPWIDAVIVTRSGWQEYAFLYLLAYAYPLGKALELEPPTRWANILSAGIALYFGFWYWITNTGSSGALEGVDLNGGGVFAYLFAAVLLVSGAWINDRTSSQNASSPPADVDEAHV